LTKSAYGLADARVTNDGSRFRRFDSSPRTWISSRCTNYGNTNCTAPGDADAARISSIIL
jgi:hypothetical protein